jgi:hypothetical protein
MFHQNFFMDSYLKHTITVTTVHKTRCIVFENYIRHLSSIRKIFGISQEGRDILYNAQVT